MQGAALQALAIWQVDRRCGSSMSLVCTAMLPPSFIEYALRFGATGVLVTGCREGGCEFRTGPQLVRQRLLGQREPQLRASVPRDRFEMVWADAGDATALVEALQALRQWTGNCLPADPAGLHHGWGRNTADSAGLGRSAPSV